MRALAALCLLLLSGCLPTGPGAAIDTSAPFQVTKFLAPLEAPAQGSKVMLIENQPGELVWLTGASVNAEDLEFNRLAPRFVADCTVDFRWPDWHNQKLDTNQSQRLFSLGQGLYSFQLPEGFGVPVFSNEPLLWNYRVCNLSAYQKPTSVRLRSELRFMRDRGLDPPFIPLLVRNFPLTENKVSFWTVPVGGKTVFTPINDQLDLRFDRRLHALSVGLHPRATGFQLRDQTTGETLLTLRVLEARKDGSLQRVETYSSTAGILLRADHQYVGAVHYENSTTSPKHGVAYVTAYLYDGQFSKWNTAR